MKMLERMAFANAYANNVAHLSRDEVMTFLEEYYTKDYMDYSGDYTSLVDAIGVWRDARSWTGGKVELTTPQLQRVLDLLVQVYGHEIARDGDWWFGIDDYDFNIHDSGDEQGTGYFNVNVYKHDGKGMSNYDEWFDFPKVFIKESQTDKAYQGRVAYNIGETNGANA